MKVYISGPITGHEDYILNFRDAEMHLTEQGHIVFNPAAVNSQMPAETTYEEYMQIAMTMLSMCDAIYLLEGWEQSRGSNREYGYALAKGMKIMKEGEECRLL